jgi:hypothetical protein
MTDHELAAILAPVHAEFRDLFSRITDLLTTLTNRVEVLELERLHRQPSDDGMMEIQAGCPDAETSEQP